MLVCLFLIILNNLEKNISITKESDGPKGSWVTDLNLAFIWPLRSEGRT